MPNSLEFTCQELYGIDFTIKMRELLPWFWEYTIETNSQKIAFMNLCEVFFNSLQKSNENLVELCGIIRDRLAYTGQVLSLETLLNDKYDDILRRIFIECLNANYTEGLDIYNNDEIDPTPIDLYNNDETAVTTITLWLNDDIEPDPTLQTISFIVHIPVSITVSDEIIRALLAFYVVGGQEYSINIF
jgi:hypothetical protein